MLGARLSAYNVVIVLEFVLAVYSIALAFSTEKKALKIVHIVFCVVWVVLAVMNLIAA